MILIYSFAAFWNCLLKYEYLEAIVMADAYVLGLPYKIYFLISIIVAYPTNGFPFVLNYPSLVTSTNL